jgi:hypothetical protein
VAVERRARAEGGGLVWTGLLDELLRVASLMDRLAAPHVEALVAEEAAEASAAAARLAERVGWGRDQMEAETASAVTDAETRARGRLTPLVEATVVEREFDHRITGSVAEALPGVDVRNVASVTFSTPTALRRHASVSVSFAHDRGVRWEVAGEDATWVRGAAGEIASEVRRNVPRWSFLRADWFRIPMVQLIGYGMFVLGAIATERHVDRSVGVSFSVGLLAGLSSAAAAVIFFKSVRGFELGGSRSGRMISSASLLIVQVLIGVLVNTVS